MDDSQEDWAASGLAALTVGSDGVADFSRTPVLAHARGRLAEFTDVIEGVPTMRRPPMHSVDAPVLLAGRAALLGLAGRGRVSANGTTRLMRASQDWWALTLSRPDDLDVASALLEFGVSGGIDDIWATICERVATRTAHEWVSRARLLDLPAAVLGEAEPAGVRVRARGAPIAHGVEDLLVVDLSSMWAGPLCTRLLADAGAVVVKVESRLRPDGARGGDPDFFSWMNHGKLSYTVDFHRDRTTLARLLSVADVVVEASRPRALRRLALGPDDIEPRPGQVWIRITGHGTVGDAENWVAFGDDAAVAGGLVGRGGGIDDPVFCGDAIADPLTGIEAACAVATALDSGGGVLLEVSMAATAATYAQQVLSDAGPPSVSAVGTPPRRRPDDVTRAARLGADTARVDQIVAGRISRR